MAYLLHSNASITTETRRVIRELLREAAGRAGSPGEDVHDDVHEIRKSLKKARAVLKLVRPHVTAYSERKNRYRDLGRQLSDVRDAAAVIESLDLFTDELVEVVGQAPVDDLRTRLVTRRDEVEDDAREILRGMYEDFNAAVAEIEDLKLSETGPGAIESGFKREYRRGRAWARSLHIDASASEFHEWRKRAKEHRYHLELLFGEAPPVDRMHALTDTLGSIQDITVLMGVVESGTEVEAALDELRQRHKARAVESGRSYYEKTPKHRVSEVMEQWRA